MSTVEEPAETVLIKKLQEYVRNRREIEAALEIDPTNIDLIELESDLSELIDLTRRKLADEMLKSRSKECDDDEKTDVTAENASSTFESSAELEMEVGPAHVTSTFQHLDDSTSSNAIIPPTIPVLEQTSRKEQPVHACTSVKVKDISDQELMNDDEWVRIRNDPNYKCIVNKLRRRRGMLKGALRRKLDPNYVYDRFEKRRMFLMERHKSRLRLQSQLQR